MTQPWRCKPLVEGCSPALGCTYAALVAMGIAAGASFGTYLGRPGRGATTHGPELATLGRERVMTRRCPPRTVRTLETGSTE